MINNFEPPRNVELDKLDNENHNWNHLKAFDLFFDDKLTNFLCRNDKCVGNRNKRSWLGTR